MICLAYTAVVGNGKHVIVQLLNTGDDINIMDVCKQLGATDCILYTYYLHIEKIHVVLCLKRKNYVRSHLQEF